MSKNKQGKSPEDLAAEAAVIQEKRNRANLNYIRRNYDNKKHEDKVKQRMLELDKAGIDYGELIRKISENSENNQE
nr:hypothetical protein [Bacteroidota bacterium]